MSERTPCNVHASTLMQALAIFFFSSRRRHTRSDRDWSSDVCSSDLRHVEAAEEPALDHQCLTRLEAGERLEGGLETEQLIRAAGRLRDGVVEGGDGQSTATVLRDRKSTRLNSSHDQISYAVFFFKKKTRLNSSHDQISYAVFCLKKKKNNQSQPHKKLTMRSQHTTQNAIQSSSTRHITPAQAARS